MKKFVAMLKRVLGIVIIAILITTLSPNYAFAAKEVKLNKTNVTLNVGQTKTLKLQNNKEKIKWSSDKKEVAVVTQKGKVTAKNKGIAIITAKVGKRKYKCKITVKERITSNSPEPTPQEPTSSSINYAIPYQTSDIGTVYKGNDYFTMMGKKYYYGFCGEPCYNSWAQYNLAGNYTTMSYTIGHVDNTAFEDATFILELDGVTVEQINLTGDMTTVTRTVDVKNKSNMKICIRDAAHVTSYYGVANIVFDDSIELLREDTSSTNISKNGVTYAIPYQKGDIGEIYKGNNYFTMMGEKYYYGFCGEPCYNSHAQINLEGKYTTLYYEIGHVDQTADEDATLLLELDGKIVEQINLTGNMTILSRTLDVTGGVNLKIQIRDAAHVTSWYGIANMILK